MGAHHMPSSHSLPTGPPLSAIERPRCKHCQARMMLAGIEPGPSGYDLRTFECAKCDRVQTALVASDPIISGDTKRWLGGELQPPK